MRVKKPIKSLGEQSVKSLIAQLIEITLQVLNTSVAIFSFGKYALTLMHLCL